MMTVVPARRTAPTEGKVPLRTFQYISQVAASVENCAGSTVAMPCSACSTVSIFSCRAAAVWARTSINRAAASAPRLCMTAGRPGLSCTERRAARSSNSTAATGWGLRQMTASQALAMVG